MDSRAHHRPFDLAIYGATGFTGKQAARQLWEACRAHGLNLTLAGRSSEKLNAVRRELGTEAEAKIGISVAESSDEEAINRLALSTRVLVNNAGPYSKYAPKVIQACVNAETDYLDITGETPFVRKMIDLHHERAHRRKIRIVPFCGFDSVPSDYSVWYALNRWKENFRDEACESVTTYFEVRGGFNGGTIESAFTLASDGEIQRLQNDLTLLCPREGPHPRAPKDWTSPRRLQKLDAWSAPFFMSPVNTRVVRRTQSLFGIETAHPLSQHWKQIRYEEGLLIRGPMAPLAARAMSDGMKVFSKLSSNQKISKWVRKLLPRPGEGPTENQMNTGFMRLTTHARGLNGSFQTTQLKAKGDPGNRITVGILTQAALCLALPEERARLSARYGVLTPAYAFEEVLFQRLKALGFEFSQL